VRFEFVGFEQTDADEWQMQLESDDEQRFVQFSTLDAMECWQAMDRTVGEHYREGRAAAAAHERDREAVLDARYGYAIDDPKHPDFLEGADMVRDRMRGK
jgi:hypothetical protein